MKSVAALRALGQRYGTDKVTRHQFEESYGRHFDEFRYRPITLLELGIGGEDYETSGPSIKMWRDFFPRAKIIGVDIYDKKALAGGRIKIEQGDASDAGFLKYLSGKYGPFDIIIDDASHRASETLTSFFHLIHHVKENGWYVIEDIQTSYWPTHGGTSAAINFVNTPITWLKHAVDIINRRDIMMPHYPLSAGFKIKELHVYQNIAFLRAGTPPNSDQPSLPADIIEAIRTHEHQAHGDYLALMEEFEQDRLRFLQKIQPPKEPLPLPDRLEHLRAMLPDKTAPGIEIAPAHNPICPKSEGWNILSVDKLSTEALADYLAQDDQNQVAELQPVDIVWRSGSLHEHIEPKLHGTFKYIVASHVFEHIPDIIRFLESVDKLLTPDGVLLLVLPDRRYTLDFFRPFTTADDIIDAYHQKREKHSRRSAFGAYFHSARIGQSYAWSEARLPDSFRYSSAEAKEKFLNYQKDSKDKYIDMHAWVFTPSSFQLVLLELYLLQYTGLQIAHFEQFGRNEFCAVMKRMPREDALTSDLMERRFQLALNAVLEYSNGAHVTKIETVQEVKQASVKTSWRDRSMRIYGHAREFGAHMKCVAKQLKIILGIVLKKS